MSERLLRNCAAPVGRFLDLIRNQFTQVRYEGPALTISGEKITFNVFCVKKYANIGYIQLLLHPTERKLAIRPCCKQDTHSIKWRPETDKPIGSKTLTCQHFRNALYGIMEWNPDYMYRIRGTWAKQGEEQIIIFHLVNAVPAVNIPQESKPTELCPDEWSDSFGEEFYEHVLENGLYYIESDEEWKSDTPSIPAPGIQQFTAASESDLNKSIDRIKRGETSTAYGEQSDNEPNK